MSGIFDQIINYSPPLIVSGPVNYKGTWNASTNNPTLNNPPAVSTKGDYYVVSTAGTQFSITFGVGDWIISNGTAWEKVDLTDAVSSVFGRTGAVVGVSTDYSAVGITNTAIGASSPSTGAFTTVSASTPIAVASGGTGVTTSTGSGANVLSTSPTLTTPISASLTSPAASNLTLGTGTFGTALTFASATGAATFSAPVSVFGSTGTEVNFALNQSGVGQWSFRNIATSGDLRLSIGGNDWLSIVRTTGAATFASTLSVSGTTTSTSTTTGSLVNAGGFGNAGAGYFGGLVSTGSRFVFTGPGVVPGASELAIGTNGVGTRILSNVPTGGEFNFTVNGTTVTAINATTGLYTTGLINSTNTTASTSTTTGSLIIAGGFGNAGAANFGSTLDVISGLRDISSGLSQFSVIATGTSAIANGGTIQLGGVFTGTSQGTFAGLKGQKENGTDNNTAGALTLWTRPAGGAMTQRATLSSVGNFSLSSTTASTSTTTGALTVAGGVGIAGTLNTARATIEFVSGVGLTSRITATGGTPEALRLESFANQAADRGIQQSFYIPNGTSREGVRFIAANASAGTPGGYLGIWTENTSGTMTEGGRFTANGNLLIGGTTDISGTGGLKVFGTTASTSTTTGSLVNAGGFGNAGAIFAGGQIRSTSATGGIGYATGAGGAVTQGTSRTTGVTLNTVCGAITLFTDGGSEFWQSFTVTNSVVAATDTIIVNQRSGTDLYMMHVTAVGAGSFRISFATTGGTTSEAPVFNFAVIKAVSS